MWVSDPLNRASYLLGGKGGETSFASSRRQTTSQLCDQFPCLSLQPPKVGKSNLVSWGGLPGRGWGTGSGRCQLGRGQQLGKKLGNKSCRPSSITAPTFLGSSCSKALSISGQGRKEVSSTQLWFFLKIQIPVLLLLLFEKVILTRGYVRVNCKKKPHS